MHVLALVGCALAFSDALSLVAVASPVSGIADHHAQFLAQDAEGRSYYGHAEPLQMHVAFQDASGNKVGSFSYVTADGRLARTDYVADADGYRVASNALPLAPGPPTPTPFEVPPAQQVLVALPTPFWHPKRQINIIIPPIPRVPALPAVPAVPAVPGVPAVPAMPKMPRLGQWGNRRGRRRH